MSCNINLLTHSLERTRDSRCDSNKLFILHRSAERQELTVRIIPVVGLPLIEADVDLASLIIVSLSRKGTILEENDILVIGQKALSKAEGRIVELADVRPSKLAKNISRKTRRKAEFVDLVLRDSRRVARAGRDALIVTTKQGFTCLNAGVDKSNVEGDESYALLPSDPDRSARNLRDRILKLTHKKIGVIVCDTNSRPLRRGQVEQAIGIAGLNAMVDYRGQRDLFGYELKFKNVAIADELASAAELVMGQGTEMTPAALIRGVQRVKFQERSTISDLTVSRREDLFRGTL